MPPLQNVPKVVVPVRSDNHPVPGSRGVGYHFLHLFSGPADRPDGLAAYIRRAGRDCEEWDIVNGGEV